MNSLSTEQIRRAPWLGCALQHLGLREAVGGAGNQAIVEWARGLGVADVFHDPRHEAWCGLFASHVLADSYRAAGRDDWRALLPRGYDCLRARAFARWGQELALERVTDPAIIGAVAVVERPGGYHVAFVVGADAPSEAFPGGRRHLLGGNQGDAVQVRAYGSRLIALRWPPLFEIPGG